MSLVGCKTPIQVMHSKCFDGDSQQIYICWLCCLKPCIEQPIPGVDISAIQYICRNYTYIVTTSCEGSAGIGDSSVVMTTIIV